MTIALALLLVGCSDSPGRQGDEAATDVPDAARPSSADAVPALDVEVLADGLDHPWDVAQAPDGTLLFDERGGGLTAVLPDGTVRGLTPPSTTCSPTARPG